MLHQHRSTQRKVPRGRADEDLLVADMIELAQQYGRYGYRRIAALLRDAGWQVNDKRIERLWRREGLKVPVKQPKKGRLWLNDGSCVRLRPEYRDHGSLRNTDGDSFEIVLVNANDGTSAYQMIPGFFRFICENGLMAGETFGEVKVRHSGDAIGAVIEGAYRVLEDAPQVAAQVSAWKAIPLQDAEREALAAAAHVLRFPKAGEAGGPPAPIEAAALLRPRRSADRAPDLWTAMNVVQENVIKGGQTGLVRNAEGWLQRRSTRAVAGIDQNRSLNRALWLLTERMAELKRG